MAIVDAKADQKMDRRSRPSGMTATIDPRRSGADLPRGLALQRDFFYDPNMHGVDWEAVREHYAPMIEDCASRDDVSYVIREMISELNVGHAYYFGGDTEDEPRCRSACWASTGARERRLPDRRASSRAAPGTSMPAGR